MRRIREHLTFANVVSFIALFVALGGTALASVIITSNSQVAQDTISGHQPPSGKHANIIAGSINGTDIADRSGVDSCQTPLVAKFGPICAGSDAGNRSWQAALSYCAGFGLRLPSVAEAVALAKKFDVPGVTPGGELFWTDAFFVFSTQQQTIGVTESGNINLTPTTGPWKTVCVTDPSA
jgi:hypothetical protein